MRVKDLSIEKVVVGLRIKSLVTPGLFGTIVYIDKNDDDFAWIKWDNADIPFSGFYGNDCICEVAEPQFATICQFCNTHSWIYDVCLNPDCSKYHGKIKTLEIKESK